MREKLSGCCRKLAKQHQISRMVIRTLITVCFEDILFEYEHWSLQRHWNCSSSIQCRLQRSDNALKQTPKRAKLIIAQRQQNRETKIATRQRRTWQFGWNPNCTAWNTCSQYSALECWGIDATNRWTKNGITPASVIFAILKQNRRLWTYRCALASRPQQHRRRWRLFWLYTVS